MAYTIRDFIEIRTAAPSGFSPDGSKMLIASNLPGTVQLYRVARGGGGPLQQITDFEEPVSGAYLPASDRVLLQMDEGGNERLQIYLLDDDGGNLEKVVFEPDYIHRVGGVSRDGRFLAYASNRRNGVDFDIYVRDLEGGDERRVFDMGGLCSAGSFSPDGRLLSVWRATERNMDNDVYLVDLAHGDVLHVSAHDEEASFSLPAWLPDSSGFFFATDDGREFAGIAKYDLSESAWSWALEFDWNASCKIDWPGKTLLVELNEEGSSRLLLYEPDSLVLRDEVPLQGRGTTPITRFSRDGRFLAYQFVSSREPGDAWVYDIDNETSVRATTSPNPLPPEEFVEPDLVGFESFDGRSIPAFFYKPRRASPPYPAVVYIHGGPEGQFVPGFNPVVQYLVNRGYAVAAPNVRGSMGYGKPFHHLDDVYKRLDSVKDLEALHGWLTSTGEVDSKRIALMGGSYGGYMTLAGLAFRPDLWAAGVDVVGISSLVTFLENTSPWRRKFREREYGSLERDKEFLEAASPITHVDRMRAPLFIIHGTNDPRVPVGEAVQIHGILREKGIPTKLLVYEDEGHGLSKLRNRLDAYPQVADFLDEVLA